MATVHRALERGIEGFERIVALKRLLPHLAADATFIKSFVREAKLASLLNHVNIVQIFELGRVATQYFISMEYIDGRDIRRILRHARKVSGPPPIHVTAGLLLQLCDALDYAHTKVDDAGHPMGLVHRDVSPSNVLVTRSGQVKVIDFGIAKAQSAQLRTQTGRVKGKLAYMAPEALAGKDLDARSDLFAVGVIAHELLTARPLFARKNEYETLMKVQRGDVNPPSTFNQGCPAELDAIVLRALARDPDDRFHHAGELRDELHAMRKRYNLQTAERDIASWLDWAFALDVPAGFAGNTDQGQTDPGAPAQPRQRSARGPRRPDDDEAVELAWGDHDEHGNGEPIVLDDVPDVSDKHLHHASSLGADVRLDVDDLDDDIPTPLPSHGRPTVDLSSQARPTVDLKGSRTVTAPQLPRHVARSKLATPSSPVRGSQAIPAQSADTQPSVAIAPPGRAPIAASSEAVSAGLRSAVIPSRVRTITIPPRAIPSGSAPPRNIAAAALPPRTATGEPSRGVPFPVAPSRSGALATEPSRSVPMPAAPSRSGALATEPSRSVPMPAALSRSGALATEPSRSVPMPAAPSRSGGLATEPSHCVPMPAAPSRSGGLSTDASRGVPAAIELSQGIPVPIEPSYDGHAPVEPSRSAQVTSEPSRSGRLPVPPRSGPAPIPAPRSLPSSTKTPRRRATTSPGTGTPPMGIAIAAAAADDDGFHDTVLTLAAPAFLGRESVSDMTTSRTPKFSIEDLGLVADTMPSMPALTASEAVATVRAPALPTSEAVAPVRAPALPTSEAVAPVRAPALLPSEGATQPDATPAPAAEPSRRPSPVPLRTGTGRTRLITPATALFAEPEPESTTTTAVAVAARGGPRPSQATVADDQPFRSRATLVRVMMVVVTFVLVSAATTAAALYLTRDGDAPLESPPAATPGPSHATGTVHFEIVPANAAITIDGKPVHVGAPWDVELAPGVHQIEIDRADYKGWLTSIEVTAGKTHPLDVSLEPLGSAVAAEATLMLGSTPGGLDIVIDGAVVGKTPDKPAVTDKLSVTAGHHTIALRAGGVEVWRKEIDARANAIQEFRPRIAEPRAPTDPAAQPAAAPTVDPPPAAAAPDPGAGGVTAPLTQVAPSPVPLPPVPPAPPSAAPVTVSPTLVTRLSGAAPRITALPNTELPPSIAVKVCIDDAGRVTSAELLTPLRSSTAREITDTLRTWQYAPFTSEGVPHAACFPLTFRVNEP